jgi:hypothetical protein
MKECKQCRKWTITQESVLNVTPENIVVYTNHDRGHSLQPCASATAELLHKQGTDRKGEQERLCIITLHEMSIAQKDQPCKDH